MSITSVPVPSAWANETALDGVDLIAKDELVGVPFLITAAWFETNKNGVEYAYVEGETGDGTPFTINDSSKVGVRQQVLDYLARIGKDDARESGEVVSFRLVIPRGLRVSEFTAKDERGREKAAKTFFLTTAGTRRGTATEPAKPAARATAKK